jgi:very-short-patch-repair endonuclease
MPTDRLDACEVVRRLGGTASWDQLIRYSTGYSARRAVASGELRRTARGIYALPETPLAYRAAASTRGLVSHGSAAQHWLLDRLNPDTAAHVTVPRHARPSVVLGVLLHFSDVPAQDDHGGITSPVRTVIDCALTLPFNEALSIADSALRRELVTSEQLIAAAQARLRNGRKRALRVATEADGRAANPFESGLRAIVIEAGILGFEPQFPVPLENGTAWVDLGDPRRRIALEADSFTYHGTPEALTRDCERYDELVRRGWLVLRFTWDHVTLRSAWVASVIAETLAQR